MKINSLVYSFRSSAAFKRRVRRASMQTLAAAWLAAAIAGGLIACGSANETPPAAQPLAEQTSPTPARQTAKKTSGVTIPRLEAALKKAVAARLNSWVSSIEERDLEKHLQYYADEIQTYYHAANVNRDFIRADRKRAFEQFDTLKLLLINIDINLDAPDAATVVFDKSWDFKKAASYSNGLVQQEIQMRKIEKQWFIVSEKDLEIYRARNN